MLNQINEKYMKQSIQI